MDRYSVLISRDFHFGTSGSGYTLVSVNFLRQELRLHFIHQKPLIVRLFMTCLCVYRHTEFLASRVFLGLWLAIANPLRRESWTGLSAPILQPGADHHTLTLFSLPHSCVF